MHSRFNMNRPRHTIAVLFLGAIVVLLPQVRGEIHILGVTTSAGFQPGLPGPGSPATIFCTGLRLGPAGTVTEEGGALPPMLQGITVTFADSFHAPIYGAADLGSYQMVNFQMPWESHAAPITLSQDGESVQIPSDPARWGEFFTGADGFAAAMHAATFSPVTPQDPARPGEWIVLYGSNFGPVEGPPATGMPAPLDREVMLDPGTPVPWNFAVFQTDGAAGDRALISNFIGLAPGLTGVYQVNVQMPDSIPAGGLKLYVQRSRLCGFFFVPGCGRGEMMDSSTTALVR